MADHAARRHLDTQDDTQENTQDDTVENGLADDLLGPADRDDTERSEAETATSAPDPVASTWPDLTDDEDYLAPAARRGKLTTGLLIALIFLVGALVGTVLTKTLSPAPAQQVVYVLSSSTSAAPVTPSTPR